MGKVSRRPNRKNRHNKGVDTKTQEERDFLKK